jgi:hypothetical protein
MTDMNPVSAPPSRYIALVKNADVAVPLPVAVFPLSVGLRASGIEKGHTHDKKQHSDFPR